jgi:hypothetical protein
MPLYRCLIQGENFPGVLFAEPDPIGFYTTRFVEAAGPAEAVKAALEVLRLDPTLQLPPAQRSNDARIHFEAVEEVPPDTPKAPNAGFTFFVMDT